MTRNSSPAQARPDAASLTHQAEESANSLALPVAGRPPVGTFLRRVAQGVAEDQLAVFAGNLTFRSLLAVFPTLIALLWLMTVFHAPQLISTLLRFAGTALPKEALEPIRTQLTNPPADRAAGVVTVSALLSCLVALWALAGTFLATMQAMNVIYQVRETRPWWKRCGLAVLLSLAITALLVGALLLIVFSEKVSRTFGLGPVGRSLWTLVSWPVLGVVVLTAFALAYYVAPDCQQRFRWISRGALVAVALWLGFTALFSLYVNHAATYATTYGALAGIVLFMVYLYYGSFILLLGAEINQLLEAHDPAGKDSGDRAPQRSSP